MCVAFKYLFRNTVQTLMKSSHFHTSTNTWVITMCV